MGNRGSRSRGEVSASKQAEQAGENDRNSLPNWICSAIEKYCKNRGICKEDQHSNPKALLELEALRIEGFITLASAASHLLPMLLDRGSSATCVRQLITEQQLTKISDQEEVEIAVNQLLSDGSWRETRLEEDNGKLYLEFVRMASKKLKGRAEKEAIRAALDKALECDRAIPAVRRHTKGNLHQEDERSSGSLIPLHKLDSLKCVLPKVQSELQSHIGHLYPAQLNTDAIELRRRLREIDTKVEESEDKAKQMGRCPSAALEDTADAMRDLRIRFRMFVECMLHWLLQMQDLCDPELKMVGPRLAELRKRVTCTPELGPLQRKLGNFSASLNNAVHARQPGIHHDDVGNLLREVVLLNGMLTEYRDFIQTQNLVHELPEVFFITKPIEFWQLDSNHRPWWTGAPAEEPAAQLMAKLQRRRDRLAHSVSAHLSELDFSSSQAVLHEAVKYYITLGSTKVLNVCPQGSMFRWHATSAPEIPICGGLPFEACNVLFLAGAAASQCAVTALFNVEKRSFKAIGVLEKACKLFQDAGWFLDRALHEASGLGTDLPFHLSRNCLEGLKELMLVQALECNHNVKAARGDVPHLAGGLAQKICWLYEGLRGSTALPKLFGLSWEAYADSKRTSYHAQHLFAGAQALHRWPDWYSNPGKERKGKAALSCPSNLQLALVLFNRTLRYIHHEVPKAGICHAASTGYILPSVDQLAHNVLTARDKVEGASYSSDRTKESKGRGKGEEERFQASIEDHVATFLDEHVNGRDVELVSEGSHSQKVLDQYSAKKRAGAFASHEESSGDEEHGHRHSQSVPSMGTPNDPAVHSVLSTQVGKVAAIEQHHAACSNLSLARYLLDWWIERMGKYVPSAPAGSFAWKLVEWFEQEGLSEVLEAIHAALCEEGFGQALDAVTSFLGPAEKREHFSFVHAVVLPILDCDPDGRGFVNRHKLRLLHGVATQMMRENGAGMDETPGSWVELLEALCLGFDRTMLLQSMDSSHALCRRISESLQVQNVITSYGVELLLKDYVEGTRDWVLEEVNTWLTAALNNEGRENGSLPGRGCMFLLLAEPGMGKSVCSALMDYKLTVTGRRRHKLVKVRHFFKVGQKRSQGKVMVLCLANQLAQQLPGLAKCLAPVAKEHGDAAKLSMVETFERYLFNPLWALDREQDQPHSVVMLLDALDEACDGAYGWERVAAMISREFLKLPPWVKIILTGRPQVQSEFSAWQPFCIEPNQERNKIDLLVLLETRLKEGDHVARRDIFGAADVLLRKSEGQFIYSKYAFDELRKRPPRAWSLSDMESQLPSGLVGVFQHVLGILTDALEAERMDLLRLMEQKVLPILVAAREPLTAKQIAAMSQADACKVDHLLLLLANLFPIHQEGSAAYVQPYHKTVLDWLSDPELSHKHAVNKELGHALIGLACYESILGAAKATQAAGESRQTVAADAAARKLVSSGSCAMLLYALRHGPVHMHSARQMECLDEILLQFDEFWAECFAAGFGLEVARELMAIFSVHKSSVVGRDVCRWLRLVGSYLANYPQAALQLACDAPRLSIVSRHANALPIKPQALLLTKRDTWAPLLSTLHGHSKAVNSVTASSTFILSGSEDKTIKVWDIATGECKATLAGHHVDWVTSIAIANDLVISGSDDTSVRLWSIATGDCVARFEGHTHWVTSVATGGKLCVSGSADTTVRVFDLEAKEHLQTLKGHTDMVTSVAMSADGALCASGSRDNTVRIWDLATGGCQVLEGHSDRVEGVAISGSGKVCVSASADKTFRVWDVETKQLLFTQEEESMLKCICISPCGTVCATGSRDTNIRLWDLTAKEARKRCKGVLEGNRSAVYSVAISSDLSYCVSGSEDKTVRIWDLSDAQALAASTRGDGHCDLITSVSMSQDGTACVSGSADGSARHWELATGACMGILQRSYTSCVSSVAVSADGKTSVCGLMDTVRVCDLDAQEHRPTLRGHTSMVTSIAISADGTMCVSGSKDQSIRLWNLKAGTSSDLEGHACCVDSVAINSCGTICISGGSCDEVVRVWDLKTCKLKAALKGHHSGVNCVSFSSNSTCISGSEDGKLLMWDLAKMRCVTELATSTRVTSLACSDSLCVFSSGMHNLRVWDLTTNKLKPEVLEGHRNISDPRNLITCVSISRDGLFCASGSTDKSIRLWDLTTMKCTAILDQHEHRITSVSLSATRICVSGGLDETLRVWDTASASQLACFPKDRSEGAQQAALAEDLGAYQGSYGSCRQQDGQAWSSPDKAVVYWVWGGTSSSAAGQPPAIYLLPPSQAGHDLLLSSRYGTLSYFERMGKLEGLRCYKLLART